MLKISRLSKSLALVSAMLCGGLACGGSTNNDQGTSFLATGFFRNADGDEGVTGAQLPLALDPAVPPITTEDEEGEGDQGGVLPGDGLTFITFLGLQNRLTNQFLRVVRIDCDYDIPGADPTLVIPQDSYNFATVIQPAAGDPDDPDANPQPSEAFAGFQMLSTDLYSYLNVNRNRLPQLPFRMIASCRATGVTQAGDTFTTNDVLFPITFVDIAECCTGSSTEIVGVIGGFQQGPGTGGTLITDGTDTGGSGNTGGATSTSLTDDGTTQDTTDTDTDLNS